MYRSLVIVISRHWLQAGQSSAINAYDKYYAEWGRAVAGTIDAVSLLTKQIGNSIRHNCDSSDTWRRCLH